MRILFATLAYKPAYRAGGPVHSVAALAEQLVERGHRVTVFTTNVNLDTDLDVSVDAPVEVDGVEVWYFRRDEPLKRWLPFVPYLAKSIGFLYTPAMRAHLDRVVPAMDLVHTHMPYVYPTYAAARAAERHGKPLFYHQRGAFDPQGMRFRRVKKRLYVRVVERRSLRYATTLFALTEAEVASYRALAPASTCPIIPNGVDVAAFRTRPRRDVLASWNVPPSSPVVLFLARLHPLKGPQILLEAFILVAGRIPQARLVIAGADEWGLRGQLSRRARDAGVAERVIFPGVVVGDVKADLLARADVLCLPSNREGFSMAVLEALASGTPVVLSPGCHFEAVEARGAGLVVDQSAVGFADGLERLLADTDRLAHMGEVGRHMVAADYSWPAVADRVVAEYLDGLERHRRRPASREGAPRRSLERARSRDLRRAVGEEPRADPPARPVSSR